MLTCVAWANYAKQSALASEVSSFMLCSAQQILLLKGGMLKLTVLSTSAVFTLTLELDHNHKQSRKKLWNPYGSATADGHIRVHEAGALNY